jgi:methyl-accepting chemotaxis protein
MTPTCLAGLAFFQTAEVPAHDIHLLMIFAGIIALALIVAAVGMVLTSVFAARLLHSVNCVVKEAKEHTGPLLAKTNALVQELGPKIHHLTENAEQISYTVREKIDEIGVTVTQINATVQEANGRTRRQVAHVDGIVSDALHAAEHVSQTVQEGIRGPVRQMAGILAGVRAGLEKLVEMSPFGRE